MGDMKINRGGHISGNRPILAPGVKRRRDGTIYRELEFPEMTIKGSTFSADYIDQLAGEDRPLEIVICIDSTEGMKRSAFMILAQIEKLQELCKKRGLKLNIEIVHYHDGEEFVQLSMTEANQEGLAKIVAAVLTIPFGNNYGGSTTGDVVTDTIKRHPKDEDKKGQAIIVFTNNPELTASEVEQIGSARDEGTIVIVTDEIMGFFPNASGHIMSRPESVVRAAYLLKIYGEYKGNGELAKRFETEKAFLLKLAYAIALDSSGRSNPVDTGFSIIWDPRFRCSSDSELPTLCLDPYGELEKGGEEMFLSGLYRFWAGTENYYSYLYQSAMEAADEDSFMRSMSVLTYDILKTAINKQNTEYSKRERIKGLAESNVSDPSFMLDYFNIDPFLIVFTIKNFWEKSGSANGDLLGYLFNNCDDRYAFKLWYQAAPVADKMPLPIGKGRSEVREIKDKLAAHLRHQFEIHDEAWRFEQLDKIVKFLDIRINILSIKDIELFIFLIENIPGLKETAVVDKKIREFLDWCLNRMKNKQPFESGDRNHDIANIYAMLLSADLISDERVGEMNAAFIRYNNEVRYPLNKGYYALTLKIELDSDSEAFKELIEGLPGSKMSMFDVLAFMERMKPDQRQRVFEMMPDKTKEWMLEFHTALFFELCSSLNREYAVELISEIVDDSDEPLRLVDGIFLAAMEEDGDLAREALTAVQGFGWRREERLMFEAAKALQDGDGKRAVEIVFERMIPESDKKYKWWSGWNWIYDVDKRSFSGPEGRLKLEQVHRNRQYPLTWAGRWLVLGKYDGAAEAMTHYLINGNANQREVAKDLLLTKNYIDDDRPSEIVIDRLRTGYDQFLADYLLGRCGKTKNCERFLKDLTEILAGYFDPEILYGREAPADERVRQKKILQTLYDLRQYWDDMPKEERLLLFPKMQKVIMNDFSTARDAGFSILVVANLKLPVGKNREDDDLFLTEQLIPAVAEWMAEARVRGYSIAGRVKWLFDMLEIRPDEYVVMMDAGHEKYFDDVNKKPYVSAVMLGFSEGHPAEFFDYVTAVLKNDEYSEPYKDLLFGWYFRNIESVSKTEVARKKVYNKETGQVDEHTNVTYECRDDKNEGCNKILAKLDGVYKIALDTEIPLKYRTSAMKHLYYIMIKFDPQLIKIDFEGLCNSLIADPETEKIGRYYLKKWKTFKLESNQ